MYKNVNTAANNQGGGSGKTLSLIWAIFLDVLQIQIPKNPLQIQLQQVFTNTATRIEVAGQGILVTKPFIWVNFALLHNKAIF